MSLTTMSDIPQQHDVILDSIADGVFTVDGDWIITSFNRAAEEITGVPRAEAIGRKCFDVFHANICQSNCALRDTMLNGRRWVDRKIDILNREGTQVPVSISTSILRDKQGKAVGGVETFRDLSALERLRREINQQYTFHDIVSKNHLMRSILLASDTLKAAIQDAAMLGSPGPPEAVVVPDPLPNHLSNKNNQ